VQLDFVLAMYCSLRILHRENREPISDGMHTTDDTTDSLTHPAAASPAHRLAIRRARPAIDQDGEKKATNAQKQHGDRRDTECVLRQGSEVGCVCICILRYMPTSNLGNITPTGRSVEKQQPAPLFFVSHLILLSIAVLVLRTHVRGPTSTVRSRSPAV
jgi:hypothetical protein